MARFALDGRHRPDRDARHAVRRERRHQRHRGHHRFWRDAITGVTRAATGSAAMAATGSSATAPGRGVMISEAAGAPAPRGVRGAQPQHAAFGLGTPAHPPAAIARKSMLMGGGNPRGSHVSESR